MKQFLIAAVAAGGLLAVGCEDSATDEPVVNETTVEEPAMPDETAEMPAAETMTMSATLAPPEGVESDGTGTGEFTFDPADNTLDYTITYAGLTGPAGAAHIHGPAEPGEDAPPVVPFADPASPITGTATLTDEQAAELMDGKYYVNVHTAAYGGGEIRGQITPAQ